MTLRGKRASLAVAAAAVWLGAAVSVVGQGESTARPRMAEEVFKDIRVLKGIPPDQFLDAMGMFAASVGYDCTGCHDDAILTEPTAFSITTPEIQVARRMVGMVDALNRTYFAGEKRVSCFTCHRGSSAPEVLPDFRLQYGEPPDYPNAMEFIESPGISVDDVFKKYWEALGGRDRAASLTSFVATGTYAGFNTSDLEVPVEVYAKAPYQRAQIVRTFEGPAVIAFDGTSGGASEPWRHLPLVTFTGEGLAGAKVDALLDFPAGLRTAFSQWKGTYVTLDDRRATLLQGSNPGELPVNLYFDDESGLLVRAVRWRTTPAGTVPTQHEFADYREVAGVKVPFERVLTWTYGRNTYKFEKIQPNVSIESSRFAVPAPWQPRPQAQR